MRLRQVLLALTTFVAGAAARADVITYQISGTLNTNVNVTVTGTTTINTGNTNPGFLSINLNFSNGTTQSGFGSMDVNNADPNDPSHSTYVGAANDLFSLSDAIQNLTPAGTKFNLKDMSGNYVGAVFNGTITVVPPPSPTPEPSSIALLGTGLLGIAGVVKRRFA